MRPSSLPAASSKAPSTCHAVCWNFGPIRKAHSTIRRFRKTRLSYIYCGSGGRAALSGKTLKELGYQTVYNAGGFKELADAGLDTEPA
jgi:rhodanese-related sulfurtransferase